MAMESIGEIIRSIGETFDADRNGSLEGMERSAFLRELMQRLPPEGHVRTAEISSIAHGIGLPDQSPPARGSEPIRRVSSQRGTELNHFTDFLTLTSPDGRALYTHLYAGYSDADRATVRTALQDRGYSHIYVYAMNEGDYGGRAVFDGYRNPQDFREKLQELVDSGLAPVVWLAPDDAPRFHERSAETLPSSWDRFIPAIDDLASSYVTGLEMDEYWSEGEQDQLGEHLNTLTDRPLFVHYTSGEWEGAKSSWVDGLIYQYGFGLSEDQITDRTTQLVSRLHALGKTFIAGEYAHRVPESEARRLGAAALRAGADGVGNGAYF